MARTVQFVQVGIRKLEISNLDTVMFEEPETNEEQLKLVFSLIESMETKLEDMEPKAQYQDAVKEMIHAKIEGKKIVTAWEEEPQVIDIMAALKRVLVGPKAHGGACDDGKVTGGKACSWLA